MLSSDYIRLRNWQKNVLGLTLVGLALGIAACNVLHSALTVQPGVRRGE